jgi:hypothetical protein
MNLKKLSIISFFFILTFALIVVISLKKITGYKVTKIPKEIIYHLNSKYFISSEMMEYLKNKKIDVNLPTKQLIEIYWVERVKEGGLILLFRHSEREKWNNSVEGFDTYELKNKSKPRNLSWGRATCLTEKGIEESKLVGESFKYAKIKISKVFSSPSCRARETAWYAFGKVDATHEALLHHTAMHYLDRKKIGMILKDFILSKEVRQGENIILSAHNKVISHDGFIDKMYTTEGLNETGFYIIEQKNNQLIVPYKFEKIKDFIILLYRH